MSDSEWAKRVSSKFQSLRAEKSQRDATAVEEETIRKKYTGSLLSDLRTAFDSKVRALNSEMGREIVSFEDEPGSSNFALRRNEPARWIRKIMIQCDVGKHTITISIFGTTPGILKSLTVDADNKSGKGYLTEKSKPTTADEVAESVIESLLNLEP